MPKTTAPTAPAQPASYEAAVQELDALVARLDAGQLPLDELLTQYQRGAQLLAYCREKLDAVEQQIQVMDGGELKNWTAGA
ncbi:exodeoxyribonuclease VII small subunit [Aquabacterium sp. A08]|uniref:exodeoxyribonuclease VII small subunit n=1 Tax=Aquabacterium sp. A08 TaxID=2718532 RepID=UPI001420DDE7|nr:exodeoxyribonuclease VII small subunit [Aquabacterium sp. A08]NIC41782.1 exodeoxyribonuclease VII small subunit [Aquabacterium sp. A08]NIC41811.1 exodeoxyribonuclease VII small subunit [Aquabacterium sp. A08]